MGARTGGRFIRNALLASAAMGCAILAATPSLAQERRTFDIPAESASEAIRTLARQSGLQVLAPAEDVRGVRTNAVQGAYEPMDAVHRLVDGTGLEVVQTGPNTVTIRRPNGAATPVAARASSEGDTTAVEEVTVTGSRIKRAGFDTLEAAFNTEAKDIQLRGYTNVLQALDETPGFVASGVDPVGTNQGTIGAGQSFADFFGLGSQRTLTLVNGQRFVSSNSATGAGSAAASGQQVDLNTIPVGLIDRVEVVAIGGAPVYGSDAISGTVNIILKDHFNGVQATAQYGVTDRGDGENQTYRVLMGGDFADGRGNAVLAAEYNEQDGMLLSSRSGTYAALPNPFGGPYTHIGVKDLVFGGFTEGGIPFQYAAPGYPLPFPPGADYIFDGSGTPLQFGKNGFDPFHVGGDVTGLGSIPLENEGGDGARFADHMGLLAPTKRVLLNGLAHYDITPHVRANLEVDYAHSQGDEISDLAGFTNPFFGINPLVFHLDNGFLTDQERATLAANGVTDTFFVARNFSDLLDSAGYTERNTVDLYRVVGGLQGDFDVSGEKWNWNVSLNYGRSRAVSTMNYINEPHFMEALDAVMGPGGNVVCRSGNDACVPLNLFGANNFSPEAAAYVLNEGNAFSTNTQRVATANLSGNLPFGIAAPIAFNVGAEYRKETADFDPDGILTAGNTFLGFNFANPFSPVHGSYDTREVYAETVVPLVSPEKPLAFINSLSFEGAARYVDNSINGGALTWSAGGRMSPNLGAWSDGLVLRGVYMHAIRSPSITELFSGKSSVRDGIDDPCDALNYNKGNDPAVRAANCTAALGALGLTPEDFHSTTSGLSAIGFSAGNPNLENETSNSWSLGFVYQPALVRGLRMSVDYSSIKLKNAIQNLDIQQTLDACYDNPNYPNTPQCGAFTRLGSAVPGRVVGDIADGYVTGYQNTASINFAGVIGAIEYNFDLNQLNSNWDSWGALRLGAKVFYNDKYEFTAFAGQIPVDNVGSTGLPRVSGQFNATYTRDKLDLSAQAIWVTSTKNYLNQGDNYIDPHFNDVPAYWKFNATIGYQLTPFARAQVAVNNVFDKQLTDSQLISRAYSTYDLIGRRYVFTLTTTF